MTGVGPAGDGCAETELRLSVIVPARNCEEMIRHSLAALRASDAPAQRWELIVVDDASTDGTRRVAAEQADRVIELAGGAHGPAFARNRGAEIARGEILVFVDADVCVAPDALRRFATAFDRDPGPTAVFGAYDAHPRAAGLVSQYRNLQHHVVHTTSAGAAETFWAGCGAIRREAFMRIGMFDERRYPRPQIEDIELGYRLRDAGDQIVLDPAIQGTHLKRWTVAGMMRTDFADRAVPWTRLLLERSGRGGDVLNVRRAERVYAWLVLAAVVGLVFAATTASWRTAVVAAFALVPVLIGNARLLAWMARERGAWFALRAIPLRLLFYIVSISGAAWALVQHASARRAPVQRGSTQAATGGARVGTFSEERP